MNIILCGLPASGKTTLGQLAAEKLQYHFIDTDKEIEEACFQKSGRRHTCRDLFQRIGEEGFRYREHEQIAALLGTTKTVIALGGGAPMFDPNRSAILRLGHIIYLKTPLDILWQRLSLTGLPAYISEKDQKRSFHETALKRLPVYESLAHSIIDTASYSIQEAVQSIISIVEKQHGK